MHTPHVASNFYQLKFVLSSQEGVNKSVCQSAARLPVFSCQMRAQLFGAASSWSISLPILTKKSS